MNSRATQYFWSFTWIVGLVGALSLPLGAQASVWEDAKAASYNLDGKITKVSDDGQNVSVTVQVAKDKTETLPICRSHVAGDLHNQVETSLVTSARAALESGDKATILYEGPFNRCISTISQ